MSIHTHPPSGWEVWHIVFSTENLEYFKKNFTEIMTKPNQEILTNNQIRKYTMVFLDISVKWQCLKQNTIDSNKAIKNY